MKALPLTLAALLLAAAPVLGAPSLRGEITVNRPVVTIGDMFEDAGALAETGIFLAPAPGTTGIVPLEAVANAARRAGLSAFDNVGFTRVRVARAATIVDAAMLDGLIAADLARRGIVTPEITAETRFDIADVSFNAEAVAEPATLTGLRYTPGNGGFTARFAIAGIDQPVDLSGRIELMTTAPRLAAMRPAGAVLTAADFAMASVPLATADAGGYASLDQLVGKQLVRQARAGIMLRPADVSEPTVVKRNARVTVFLRAGAMTLTVQGTALGTAAAGEPVDVLNIVTKKILHGVARADGAVEIVTATAVAGL